MPSLRSYFDSHAHVVVDISTPAFDAAQLVIRTPGLSERTIRSSTRLTADQKEEAIRMVNAFPHRKR